MSAGKQKTGHRSELYYVAKQGFADYVGQQYLLVNGKYVSIGERDSGKLKLFASSLDVSRELQKLGDGFKARLLGRAPTTAEIKANKLA